MGTAIYHRQAMGLDQFYKWNYDDEMVWVMFIAEESPPSFLDDCENVDGRTQHLMDTIDELGHDWQGYDMTEIHGEVLFAAIRYAISCGVNMEV